MPLLVITGRISRFEASTYKATTLRLEIINDYCLKVTPQITGVKGVRCICWLCLFQHYIIFISLWVTLNLGSNHKLALIFAFTF